LKLYVINLDRSHERLAHMQAIFEQLGLEFTRVAAVDGNSLPEEEFLQLTKTCRWHHPLTRSEVGCLLSHRYCLHLAMASEAAYTAVFEDDIIISPRLAPLLRDGHWIPEGIDMVKLDTAGISCVTEPLRGDFDASYKLGRLLDKHYCTGGYIIAKKAAAELYQITREAFAPIDEIYYNPDCGILPRFNIQQMVPAPVKQADLPSTIRKQHNQDSTDNHVLPLPLKRKKTPLPWWQKLLREWERCKKKHLKPLWLVLTRRARWGKIDFG